VHEKVKSRVEQLMVEKIRKLKLGGGFDPETDIGPLVSERALNKTKYYCQIGVQEGAKLLVGGQAPSGLKGWFFEPTLFTDCTSEMRICGEEIFGPIVAVVSARNLYEAIELANSAEYGLSSAIYTSSIESAFTAVKRLQAGLTYINHPTVGSEVHLPFGGVKYSGNNRESGAEGVNEYTELKTVFINYSSNASLDIHPDAP
jgi:aldehyde dehydrogenase (NAD+)